ncbi:MAG: protein kinase [Planctomycetes bacterium]|nr:protein kinase [Planctomycetota bacterium]
MTSAQDPRRRIWKFLDEADPEVEQGDGLLGQIALEKGYLKQERLDQALAEQGRLRADGQTIWLGQVLLRLKFLTDEQLADILRAQRGRSRILPVKAEAADGVMVGQKMGKYSIKRVLGTGGTAVLYQAEDLDLQRTVALKVLREDAADPTTVVRLHREAKIAAQLDHPNIVRIHEVGAATDPTGRRVHYIAMDYVEGPTLQHLLSEGATSQERLLEFVEAVARGVGHAHSKGVVHRDLKPSNVLVDSQGRAMVTDFGLARAETLRTQLTQSNTILGTPLYMAPEQASGRTKDISPRTDVYALGAMLYEVLTGDVPHTGETPGEVYANIISRHPFPVRTKNPKVPVALEAVVMKALEKNPAHRYATADELAEDLARFREGGCPLAKPHGRVRRWWRRAAGRRGLWFAGAIVVLGAGLSFIWVGRPREKTDEYLVAYQAGIEEWNRAVRVVAENDFDRDLVLKRATKAGEAFHQAALAAPERPEPWLMIGRCLMMQGQAPAAEQAWTEALRRRSEYVPARFERAKYYASTYAWMRLRPAIRVSKGRVHFGPVAPETSEHVGWRRKAEADLDEVRRLTGLGSAEMRYLEGVIAYAEGNYSEAEPAIVSYAGENPWDAEAQAFLGLSRYYAMNLDRAEESLSRGLRLESHSAWHKARADVRFCLRKFEAAVEDYRAALTLEPADADVYCNMGLALKELGKLKEAERMITRALQLQPDHARALSGRGTIRVARKDISGAKRDFEEAILAEPTNPELYNNLGCVLAMENDPDGAIAEFDCAVQIDPDYAEAYRNRGLALRMLDRSDEAIADFQTALKMVPDDPETHYALALALKSQGKKVEASRHLQEALRASSEWGKREEVKRLIQRWSEE